MRWGEVKILRRILIVEKNISTEVQWQQVQLIASKRAEKVHK
jgi:hypothetical protein